MQKWVLYSAIIVFFIFAVLIMNLSSFLDFGPIKTATRWEIQLDLIGEYVATGEWEQAFLEAKQLEEDWRRVIRYVQFSVEFEEFRRIEKDFIKLHTALQEKNFFEIEKQRLLIKNAFVHLST